MSTDTPDRPQIRILSGEDTIGVLSSFEPTDRIPGQIYQLPSSPEALDFSTPRTYTASVSEIWVSPHLTNLVSPFCLSYYDGRELPWRINGPTSSLGNYESFQEALDLLSEYMHYPWLENPVYGSGFVSWRVRDLADLG